MTWRVWGHPSDMNRHSFVPIRIWHPSPSPSIPVSYTHLACRELAKVPVYGTVAVVCSLHAAVSHFLDELLIVLLEELQQRLAFYAQPEAGVPQPGGGDIAVGLHQFLVTAVHVDVYKRQQLFLPQEMRMTDSFCLLPVR